MTHASHRRTALPRPAQLKVESGPAAGAMCHILDCMVPGDTLDVRGPAGGPVLDFSPGGVLGRPGVTRLAVVVGGSGQAAALQVVRTAVHTQRYDVPLDVVVGAGTPDQLAFLPLLQSLAAEHPGWLTLTPTVDKPTPDWTGRVGIITPDLLADALPPPTEAGAPSPLLVILCGPYAMCQALKKSLAGLGYTPEQVYSYM